MDCAEQCRCDYRFNPRTLTGCLPRDENKFQVDRGTRQVCALSPLVFIVVLDSILKKTNTDAPGGSQWRPQQNLDYAYDICHRLPELKDKLVALLENAKQVELRVDGKSLCPQISSLW